LLQRLAEYRIAGLGVQICLAGDTGEHAHAPHPAWLLRARRKRPRRRGGSEKRDEIAACQWVNHICSYGGPDGTLTRFDLKEVAIQPVKAARQATRNVRQR
jgi:hypothetical protein